MKVYKESSGNDVIDEIEKGTEVTTLKMAYYTQRYNVRYDGSKIGWISGKHIEKPKKERGPTENLKIQSATLISQGNLDSIFWNGSWLPVRAFNNTKSLISSITDGISQNIFLSDEIKEQIIRIVSDVEKPIIWDGTIDYHEINEIGKYLNELIIGIKMLSTGKINKFVIPMRSNFPGVDSFICKKNEIIPISMKYGEGAVSQLYPLISKIRFDPSDRRLKNSQIWRLLTCYPIYANHVYAILDFAIKKILRFDIDIEELYEDARDNQPSKNLTKLHNHIIKYCDNWRVVVAFPQSLTSYCAKITTAALNNCLLTKEVIKNHLEEMNLYQYHLCNESWHQGRIVYREKKVSEYPFVITQGKSSINSLNADRGLLCYRFGENTTR